MTAVYDGPVRDPAALKALCMMQAHSNSSAHAGKIGTYIMIYMLPALSVYKYMSESMFCAISYRAQVHVGRRSAAREVNMGQ